MGMSREISRLVESTPFVDTHEHLWDESARISALEEGELSSQPATDIGLLFSHYADSDLIVAGMSGTDREKLTSHKIDPKEKWHIIEPFYQRCRHTGYMMNVRDSVRILYGEDEITERNSISISEKMTRMIKPGFYEEILKKKSNLKYCQVNALDTPVFRDTENPGLLMQDLSTLKLVSAEVETVGRLANREVGSLKDWHEVIDWCFATYGPRAIATKNQGAYGRPLLYEEVPEADAAPLFDKHLLDKTMMTREERYALEDHLFHYCVDKATEYKLPVKMHTGYYAGHGGMPLTRVRANAGDLCPLFRAHPDARFDLFHIDYPYQDEMIAIAKHYPKVYIDMCWAWIINPAACVRFVKEFVVAAPACKLFTFGGDYMPVELVPGHASVARKGLAQAINELHDEGWISSGDVEPLIVRLMNGNALEVFDYEGKLSAWNR